eukprot:TRINITY_DN57963_c0_g1_i1.p1 TRINITY_DN57963_c0_g1~~TRINITY_DN57963_c0_g1_i1.p1  ORF type:complete len:398 (+),score=30.61 TRINITY_DN57963_c0_g1_i1:127-1320(+)
MEVALHEPMIDDNSDKASAGSQDELDAYEVLQTWPLLRLSLQCCGVMPVNHSWTSGSRCAYVFYSAILVPIAMTIAAPYVLYEKFWLHVHTSLLSSCLLTLTATSPGLSWLCLFQYVRSAHFLKIWLPLASRFSAQETVAEVMVDSMWSHIKWALGMSLFYEAWSASNLISTWPSLCGVAKITMSICVATFPLRAWVQCQLCHLFQITMRLHRETLVAWFNTWSGRQDGDICKCMGEVDHNVAMRNRTERDWSLYFLVLLAVPCVVVVLLTYTMIRAPVDATFDWLEFGYVVYYARQMYLAVDAACFLSIDAKKFRYMMLKEIARGNVAFKNTHAFQQEAFLQWLSGAYRGFTILGFEISAYVRFRGTWLALAFIVPIAYKAFCSVIAAFRLQLSAA